MPTKKKAAPKRMSARNKVVGKQVMKDLNAQIKKDQSGNKKKK